MELKKVTGAEPEKYEKLRGGTFVNVLPVKVEIEGSEDMYEYYQVFTTEVDETRLDKLYDVVVAQVTKESRIAGLANLTVEVDGHVFDANETARNNMMAAILSAELIGKTEESWKLADNSVVVVTLAQLKETLAKAIQAVGEIVKG